MADNPLTETISIRVTPLERKLLELIAAQETRARGVGVSVSWVVRLLVNKHGLSHLSNENRQRFARIKERDEATEALG